MWQLVVFTLVFIPSVYLIKRWYFNPTPTQIRIKAFIHAMISKHMIRKACRQELKSVYGCIPKRTKKYIKVGKHKFKTMQEFTIYSLICISKYNQKNQKNIAKTEDTTNERN